MGSQSISPGDSNTELTEFNSNLIKTQMENTDTAQKINDTSMLQVSIDNAQMFSTPTARELCGKFRSKAEVYRFLTVEVGMYHPKQQQVTIYFLKDLMAGTKKRKCSFSASLTPCASDLKVTEYQGIVVPAYESLTVQKIWLYVNSFPETKAYYPDPKDREYLPKNGSVTLPPPSSVPTSVPGSRSRSAREMTASRRRRAWRS